MTNPQTTLEKLKELQRYYIHHPYYSDDLLPLKDKMDQLINILIEEREAVK